VASDQVHIELGLTWQRRWWSPEIAEEKQSCVIAMGSVGYNWLSCTATPAYRNWLGLINEFVTSFSPNHKSSLTNRIYT
jgi:hypothetical protein